MPADTAAGSASSGEEEDKGAETLPGAETAPYHISFSDVSSLTILLSDGDRPVFAPE